MSTQAETLRFFEHLYSKYNNKGWIKTDPIIFPHSLAGNSEFIALTSALFAYGNVKAIQGFLSKFFEAFGTDPFSLREEESLKYRFQNEKDIKNYIKIIKKVYNDFGSLEGLFRNTASNPYEATGFAIERLRSYADELTPGLNFLFALPGKSASKRLMMFLRWMIRHDEVDLGLWKAFPASALYMPLDTHIKRLCVSLGVLREVETGKKALEKVNAFFLSLSPEDPVKYDFSLTRLGIACGCKYQKNDGCISCQEKDLCVFN